MEYLFAEPQANPSKLFEERITIGEKSTKGDMIDNYNLD